MKLEENEDQEATEREQIAREQAQEQAAITNLYLQAQQQQQYLQQQQQQQQMLSGGQQAYHGGQQAMNGSQQPLNGGQRPVSAGQQLMNGAQQPMNMGQHQTNMGQQQTNMGQQHIPPMLQPQVFDMTGFDTLPVLASTTPSVAASPMDALSVTHGPGGGGGNVEGVPDIDWV